MWETFWQVRRHFCTSMCRPTNFQNETWVFENEDILVAVRIKISKEKMITLFCKSDWIVIASLKNLRQVSIIDSKNLRLTFYHYKSETAWVSSSQFRLCSLGFYTILSYKNEDEKKAVFQWWGPIKSLEQWGYYNTELNVVIQFENWF